MSKPLFFPILILVLLSVAGSVQAQDTAAPEAAANTVTAAISEAADAAANTTTAASTEAAPAEVPASEPAAAAPPAPDSFGSDRLWIKLEGGGGLAFQGKLEDTLSTYKRQAEALGAGFSGEVSRASFSGGLEIGYLVNPRWGFSFEAEALFPGSMKAEALVGGGTWTQEISQMVVPATLNAYSYLPQGKRRFFVTAGGGVMLSRLSYEDTFTGAAARSADFSGIGPCIRLGAGHQWLVGKNVLEAGIRGLWGSVSRYTGSVTDELGTYDAAMAEDADGNNGYIPKASVGTDGWEYLKMGLLDIDLRVGVSLLF